MWPFTVKNNSKPTAPKPKRTDRISKIGSRMVRVSSLDFFGPYSESENNIFTLGWSGSDYFLAKKDAVLLKGTLQVLSDGKVANDGTFILNDLMLGDELDGTFYVFDMSGTKVMSHYFEANLYNNGISPNGKYAVCQCANSNTGDSGVLAFFDIEAGLLLWKIKPKSGWAYSYSFDMKNRYLYLECQEEGKFRYNFDGEFVDKEKWEAERDK